MDRLDRIEQRLAEIERRLGVPDGVNMPIVPWSPAVQPICGCKAGTVCGNLACPHRVEVPC